MLKVHTIKQLDNMVEVIKEILERDEGPACLTENASGNGIIMYRENSEDNSCLGRRGIALADGTVLERNKL